MKGTGTIVAALVAALLAALPWCEGATSAHGIVVAHSLVILLLVVSVIRRMREGAVILACGWEWAAGLLLAAACTLSFLRADYLYGSFSSLWSVAIALLFAGALLLAGPAAWPISAAVVAGGGALQAVLVFVMPAPPNMTPSGSFANANQLAAYLDIAALVSLGLAIDAARRRARAVAAAAGACAALDAAALLSVGARGALFALLLAGALWVASSVRRGPRERTALWGAVLLLAAISAAAVVARFDRIADPYRFDRVGIWRAGLTAAADHPVLGMGPGMFQRRWHRYNFPLDRETFRFSKIPASTHSTYVQLLAETGASGLGAAAILILLVARGLWRPRPPVDGGGEAAATGAGLSVYACLIQGLVDTPFETPAVTLSLIALAAPLLAPRGPGEAPLFVAIPCGRAGARLRPALILTGALLPALLGAVLLPYAGYHAARQGRLASAIRFDSYNPIYRAARAESAWRRDAPLDPATLAAVHLDLAEAHRLDPGNPDFLLRLAQLHRRACFEIGADPAAVGRAGGFYRSALALGLKDPRPRLELAAFLMAQGRRQEGRREIRAALALEPRYLGAQLAWVRALLEEGEREEAVRQHERLRELMRELSAYHPKNGYERNLMRLDPDSLAGIEARLK